MTSKLKIAFVLDDTLDSTDGIQQYMLTLSGWLEKRGHTVHYIVGETHRTDLARVHSMTRNLKVKFNGNGMSMPMPVESKLVRDTLREIKPDIIHVQVPYSPFMAGMVLRQLNPNQVAIGTFHILPYGRFVTLANHALSLLTHGTDRRFDGVMAVSEPAAAFARRIYKFEPVVVPNPIDVARFSAGVAATHAVPRIVFLGRLVERKGAQKLLTAIAYLRENLEETAPFEVYIGGKGPLLEPLKQFVTDHNLEDIVMFSGYVAETDKVNYLASADIAVFPSLSGESFGISVVEALAATNGVVLAGDNPGYRSVLGGLPELLIDPSDTPAFAASLQQWLHDSTARTASAKRQKAYAAQFDIERVGKEVEKQYYQALQNRRHS